MTAPMPIVNMISPVMRRTPLTSHLKNAATDPAPPRPGTHGFPCARYRRFRARSLIEVDATAAELQKHPAGPKGCFRRAFDEFLENLKGVAAGISESVGGMVYFERVSWHLARGLAAAVAVGFVLMAAASQAAAAAPKADSASTSQQALLNAMGRLDGRLAKTIAKSKSGKKIDTYLGRRTNDNFKIADKFMFRPISGVKASDWFRQLACVDVGLAKATLRQQGALRSGGIDAMISSGASCGQVLAGNLTDEAARADLAALNSSLQGASVSATSGTPVAPLIAPLQQQLLEVVDRQMQRPVYGVAGGEWFRQLGCVNRQLALAKLREKRILKRGNTRSMLSGARRCAQSLASQLKNPAAQHNPAAAIVFGSNSLAQEPQPLTGYFNEDAEYWLTSLAPQPPAPNYVPSATVPADGIITEIKLHGYAVRGPYPTAPVSSLPIRFSVARPQPNGELEVVTTTDPPFTLPATDGIRTFSMSQVNFACCRAKKGDVISFNARNGEFAVTAKVPGSAIHTFTTIAGEATMDPGYKWIGRPHDSLELLMQVTEQPDG